MKNNILNKKFSRLLADPLVSLGGQQNGMRYLISSTAQHSSALKKWILTKRFLDYENPTQQLQHQERRRARNMLYKISIAAEPAPLIMKVFAISHHYKWRRRWELYIQHWFKDYNLNAFHACIKLHGKSAGIVEPIAYWSYYSSYAHRKSYFLYRAISIDYSLADLCQKLSGQQDCCQEIASQWLALIAALHQAHWRHRDPSPKNIGLRFHHRPDNTRALTTKDIHNSQLYLFDYDKSQPLWSGTPRWLRLLFDLRCLRFVSVPGLSDAALVRLYLQQRQAPLSAWEERLAMMAFAFWKKRAYSLSHHLRRYRKYKKGRHLRKDIQ